MPDFDVLHQGAKGTQTQLLAAAMNERFSNRSLADRRVHVYEGRMTLTADLHAAAITCAWALGASQETIDKMRRERIVTAGANRMIRSPGVRNATQRALGERRIANMRAARKRRAEEAARLSESRRAVCDAFKLAAANYRRNPGAYHYLAGGVPNIIIMRPTPHNYRSDCSQFAVNGYREAGVKICPGIGTWMYSNTVSVAARGGGGKVVKKPKPGDFGMYGSRYAPHHMEAYIGEPGCEFIGHGSTPIDSTTPGRPDYYLSFLD